MAEVTTTTDFTPVNPVYYWTQRVLPLVYEDSLSRTEIMGKIIYTLNQVIKDMNLIPKLIAELIKEYITSGAIEGVITEILLNTMINVKYPPNGLAPAKGDGTTDDTATIQGCIDYAATVGGMVLIPYGKYLTGSLEMKSNTALVGNDKYCSILVAKGGITSPFIGGNVYNFTLRNLTLDAQGSFQVNTVDGVSMTVNDAHFDNLIIKNSHSSMLLEKNGGQIELNNILFDTATDSHLVIGGTLGHLNANTLFLESISILGATVALMSDGNGDVFDNVYINSVVPVGLRLDGDNNVFRGVITNNAVKKVEDNGTNNNITVDGVLDEKYYSDYISFKTVGYTEEIMGTRISNSQSSTESITNTKVVNAKDIVLNTTNPLTYKAPAKLNSFFSYVPAKDYSGNNYNILVEGAQTNIAGTFDTVQDMVTSNPDSGSYLVLGYYAIGDNYSLIYTITDTESPVSVTLPNGKFATPQIIDLVTPETFGIIHAPTTEQVTANNARWKKLCDYVNQANGINVKFLPKVYVIYEPLFFSDVSLYGTMKVGGAGYLDGWTVIKAGAQMPVVGNTTSGNGISRNKSCIICCEGNSLSAHIKVENLILIATGLADAAMFITQYNYLSVEGCTFVGGNSSCVLFGLLWMSNFKHCTIKPNQSLHAMFLDDTLGATSQGTSLIFENIHVDINDNVCVSAYDFSKLNYSTMISCGCDHMTAKGSPYKFNASYMTLDSCACEFTSSAPIASCIDITNGNTILNNFVCYSDSQSIDIDVFAKVSGDNTGLTINGRHYPYFCKKQFDLTGVSYMAIHLNIMNQISDINYIADAYPSYGFIILNAPEMVGYVKNATMPWAKFSQEPVS